MRNIENVVGLKEMLSCYGVKAWSFYPVHDPPKTWARQQAHYLGLLRAKNGLGRLLRGLEPHFLGDPEIPLGGSTTPFRNNVPP